MGNLIHVFIHTWKMKSPRFGPKMIHKRYDPGTPKMEVWKMSFLLNMKSIHAILVKNPEKFPSPISYPYPVVLPLSGFGPLRWHHIYPNDPGKFSRGSGR